MYIFLILAISFVGIQAAEGPSQEPLFIQNNTGKLKVNVMNCTGMFTLFEE